MLVIRSARLRRVLNLLLPLLILPAAVLLGVFVFDEKKYAFIIAAFAVLTLVYFITGFEKRRVGTRRLIASAVLTALAVVGRFIPVLKPMTAIAVIAGIWLGGESGFFVGAFSVLVSDLYYGIGPWTPFQMLALGLAALGASALGKPLRAHRWLLVVYGVIAGVFFSLVMDVWTVLWYTDSPTAEMYLAALGTALPFTLSYAVGNALFLWLLGPPFGKKLDRIKTKYGI